MRTQCFTFLKMVTECSALLLSVRLVAVDISDKKEATCSWKSGLRWNDIHECPEPIIECVMLHVSVQLSSWYLVFGDKKRRKIVS
ncbi:hypothetical protein A4A49_34518 [Nicotiana attenuata]|uniref:Secreted protein n=1 Tax=Nicotiana attenuata TaxID=49451 RepID=A0A1J6LBA0_NICAT|nr:hypothetical protein A4A49_34518 [Nicotiana attenuata]